VVRGQSDLVLCLALLHHVCLSANFPVRSFLDRIADMGSDLASEFVTRQDPTVQRLLRHREELYGNNDLGPFEAMLGERF
jgi:hypothetical protein